MSEYIWCQNPYIHIERSDEPCPVQHFIRYHAMVAVQLTQEEYNRLQAVAQRAGTALFRLHDPLSVYIKYTGDSVAPPERRWNAHAPALPAVTKPVAVVQASLWEGK